jgi:hypothetical protein
LVVGGPGWSFVKKYEKHKDGRSAVLALKMQAEGTSAKITCKIQAYALIESSAYHGLRKCFTFTNYVTLHQAAHNELLDLDEPVAESKKVSDFLKGIHDPNLTTAKSVVLGDPAKLDDFKECQQYFSTIVSNLSTQAKVEHHVAYVGTDGGGGGGSLVDRIKGGTYTDEQFRSLSPEEKRRVQKLREEANKKKKLKRQERRKCKAAKLKSEREDASGGDDETPEASSNAGAQFGSHGNCGKKTKS